MVDIGERLLICPPMSDDPDEPLQRATERPGTYQEQRILVLHNADFGESSDGDPSFESRADVVNQAHDVSRALVTRGHFVDVMGIDRRDLPDLLERLREDPPDLVFNLVESLAQVDQNAMAVTALLELFDVPFTGPGTLSVGICCNKQRTKQILKAEGLPTPRWGVVDGQFRSRIADLTAVAGVGYPAIVKLLAEDGSLGISSSSVVYDDDALARQLRVMREQFPGRKLLVEQFIDGRELYVALLGDRMLPVTEIDLSAIPAGQPRIVTYDGKWTKGSADYLNTPSSRLATGLSLSQTERLQSVARNSFAALAVCDYGRVDLRLASDGTPYVLEVNPNCDLSDGAGLSHSARAASIPYDQMIDAIAVSARERFADELPVKRRANSSDSGQ